MFHYAPGGIVAFAGQDESLVQASENQERGDRYAPVLPIPAAKVAANTGPTDLQGMAPAAAQRLRDVFSGNVTLPKVQSKEDIRQAMIDKATAEGDADKVKMLSQVPGEALIPLVKKLNEQNEEQRAGFDEGQGRMGLAALSNALIAAGEATRGRAGQGIGDALGGFGKSYNAFTAEDVQRIAAQKTAERAQNIEVANLQSRIDDLRSAYANGTIQDKQEAEKAALAQAMAMETLGMGAAKDILSSYLNDKQVNATIGHYADMKAQAENQLAQLKIHQAAQQKDWEDQRANRAKQLQLMESNTPTKEDKEILRIESTLNRNPDYVDVNKRLALLGVDELDNPTGQFLRATRDAIRADAYKRAGLETPPPSSLPKASDYIKPEAEKPGFFKKIGNVYDNLTKDPGSKAVPFSQLPK
jgi:hypothetical protein